MTWRATSTRPATVGVAASASAGLAVSEALIDAGKIIDAVTGIVDEVNVQATEELAAEEAARLAGDDAVVTAQSGPSSSDKPKMFAARVAAGLHGLRSSCQSSRLIPSHLIVSRLISNPQCMPLSSSFKCLAV